MAATMVPTADRLPDALPTDRLSASGRAAPDIRADLRRIPGLRNAGTVLGAWAQIGLIVGGSVWIDRWWVWPIAVLLMGRSFALLLILAHEAGHRLLFTRKSVNDLVGRWMLAAPGFVPYDLYRRSHMAHHRDEMGPDEPDTALYAGYPITRTSLRRKLTRDALGSSGWKNLKPILRGVTKASTRHVALPILGVQVVIFLAFLAAGWPQLYLVLWLLPWMTSWRVINRLRAIAEHGGMIRSSDRRETTHHVQQRLIARFWMVPYNTGWHLAHHVDSGIPWRALPKLHRELEAAGWVTPALTWPSYTALWRALSAR
ncbi:MAG: fatty acid desaturase family protein [Acidimicrobiales bacterium]